jgi:hypothetical protein
MIIALVTFYFVGMGLGFAIGYYYPFRNYVAQSNLEQLKKEAVKNKKKHCTCSRKGKKS